MPTDATLPLVLLHAYPLDSRMWRRLRDRLGDRTIVAPDLPGFGRKAPGAATLDGFAADVLAEMDAAGIERAIVGGLSMGGYVAFRLWEHASERVAGLILADTRAGADTEAAAEKRLAQAERARNEGVAWIPAEMLDAVLGETTRRSRPGVVEEVREMMADADAEGVARALLAMRARPDSRPLLPKISVPTLVIVGDEDTLTPIEESRTIAEGIGDAELAVISGAGHLSAIEDPESAAEAIEIFLGARSFR